MSNDLNALAVWTFISPCDIPNDVDEMLVEGEKPVCFVNSLEK
mgnify:CR=1 FL=1